MSVTNILSRVAYVPCTDYISVCMTSARASIIPVIGMLALAAYRTGLTCVCRIHIENFYTCKFSFVFYVLCKSVE